MSADSRPDPPSVGVSLLLHFWPLLRQCRGPWAGSYPHLLLGFRKRRDWRARIRHAHCRASIVQPLKQLLDVLTGHVGRAVVDRGLRQKGPQYAFEHIVGTSTRRGWRHAKRCVPSVIAGNRRSVRRALISADVVVALFTSQNEPGHDFTRSFLARLRIQRASQYTTDPTTDAGGRFDRGTADYERKHDPEASALPVQRAPITAPALLAACLAALVLRAAAAPIVSLGGRRQGVVGTVLHQRVRTRASCTVLCSCSAVPTPSRRLDHSCATGRDTPCLEPRLM